MKSVLPLLFLLSVSITCSGASKEKAAATPVTSPVATASFSFSEPWNTTFKLRETENGEMLSIGALCTYHDTLYVYDMAAGTIVRFDPAGKAVTTIPLASIGRNSYVGDDFIVQNGEFIFLNTVDRKLERFSTATGKHTSSIQIPQDFLADVNKRSHRILSRIFLDNGRVFIGNDHVVAPFDVSLGKRTAASKLSESGDSGRYLLFSTTAPLFEKDSSVKFKAKSARALHHTHYPVSGKRVFTKDNHCYVVSAGKDSVTIRELK